MTRLQLFASALAPGVLVAGIRLFGTYFCLGVVITILGLFLFPLGFWVIRRREDVNPEPLVITDISDDTLKVPTYVVSVLFPFLFIQIQDISGWIAFSVFIVILTVILIKSDITLVNPTLLIIGYRIYDVEVGSGKRVILISKKSPRKNSSVEATPLAGEIYIIREGNGSLSAR